MKLPSDTLEQEMRDRLAEKNERIAELRETVEDLVWQFGYSGVCDGRRCISDGGLSALEGAFAVLGWESPYFVPDEASGGCDVAGCQEWSSSGNVTPDGYKWLCLQHGKDYRAGAPLVYRETTQ